MARKCKAPQVVGEIIAGLLIGPCVLNLVHISDTISVFAEIGVVLLMFSTGLGTNLKELIKAGPIATLIACVGVAVPLVGGTLLYSIFYGFCCRGQHGVLQGAFHWHHHDGHQRFHHGGGPAGDGPSEELPRHDHRRARRSLMMSSASWC